MWESICRVYANIMLFCARIILKFFAGDTGTKTQQIPREDYTIQSDVHIQSNPYQSSPLFFFRNGKS